MALPDSPECSDAGTVDQSVMLEGKSASFAGFSPLELLVSGTPLLADPYRTGAPHLIATGAHDANSVDRHVVDCKDYQCFASGSVAITDRAGNKRRRKLDLADWPQN